MKETVYAEVTHGVCGHTVRYEFTKPKDRKESRAYLEELERLSQEPCAKCKGEEQGLPSPEDIALVRSILKSEGAAIVNIHNGEMISLPPSVVKALNFVIEAYERGEEVQVISEEKK